MINPQRGEIALTVNGETRRMRLSLGALAALEAELEAGSLVDLVERFETGAFRSSELSALIWAGLNGGGWEVGRAAVDEAEIGGGPIAAAKAAARLLEATFGGQP